MSKPVEGRDFDYVFKPCPFCNGYAHMAVEPVGLTVTNYQVVCSACGASADKYLDKGFAVEAWNRRWGK